MNEQIRNILVQETTKTSKIRQLYLLGVPRAEIARMVTNGNYGFVVNALRRMREREGGPNVQPLAAAPDYCNLQIFLCLFLEKLNMPQNTPVTKAS